MSSACPPEDGCTHTRHSDAPSTDLGRHQFLLFVLQGKTWFYDNHTVIPISSTLWWKPECLRISIPVSKSDFQVKVWIQPGLSTAQTSVISHWVSFHQLKCNLPMISQQHPLLYSFPLMYKMPALKGLLVPLIFIFSHLLLCQMLPPLST
jgi:hypothetical protein